MNDIMLKERITVCRNEVNDKINNLFLMKGKLKFKRKEAYFLSKSNK